MPAMRLVKKDEYDKACTVTPADSLQRWCVDMVKYAFKTSVKVETKIINLAIWKT